MVQIRAVFNSKFALNVVSIFGALCWLVSPASAGGHKAVQFREIQSWKEFGPLWASGYSASGELLGIYDLSYPKIQGRVKLGLLDPRKKNYEKSVELLEEYSKSDLISDKEKEKLKTVLSRIKKHGTSKNIQANEVKSSILDDQWWKTIPWVNTLKASSNEAPRQFLLSDIDFEGLRMSNPEFEKNFSKIDWNVVNQIEFVHSDGDSYSIYWNNKPIESKSGEYNTKNQSPAYSYNEPKKIIDFRCPKCSLKDGIIYDLLAYGLETSVTFIPIPIVAGFLYAALTEYYTFRKELLFNHLEMAVEMLETAEDTESSYFSFATLTTDQRAKAAASLLYSESDVVTCLRWLGNKPRGEWLKQKQQEYKNINKSIEFFEHHDFSLRPLNSRFTVALDSKGQKRIYPTSSLLFDSFVPPTIAIDYSNPLRARNDRLVIEAAHVLLSFFQAFIPVMGIGPISSILYGATIKDQMHKVQHWESRLFSHLLSRESKGESWDLELDLIRLQQLNPFELSRLQSMQLVEQRKSELGLAH